MDRPDAEGYFGAFGGSYVPEPLAAACKTLEDRFDEAWQNSDFRKTFEAYLETFVGRPSPITDCTRMGQQLGVRLLLKREDLNHTGSHKINNVIGQTLLARYMGKTRLIAETGAGQHGVAVATAAARFGMPCVVYMGATDIRRQSPNVERMKLLGAEVKSVSAGAGTLKEAINEAMRGWVEDLEHTHLCLGTVMGPHPYPWMVRSFQSVIGVEARAQARDLLGTAPDVVVACTGGGSNASGLFSGFVDNPDTRLVGVEAAGAASSRGRVGVVHGMKTMVLQDANGQILEAESVAAGLDYPGFGPELAHLAELRRIEFHSINDQAALSAFQHLSSLEGIIPALESAHAVAWVINNAESLKDCTVLVGLSGRGDKDMGHVLDLLDK